MRTRDAVDDFLMDRAVHCSAETVQNCRYFLEPFVTFFSDRDLASLVPADLKRFVIYQRTRERVDLRPGNLAPATIRKLIRVLRNFFGYHLQQGNVVSNPALGLQGPRSFEPPKAMTAEQVQQVLECLDSKDWRVKRRDRALVLFALDSGCRAGEIVSLDLAKLHLPEMFADVMGKGSRGRRVVFSARTADALREYIGDRREGSAFLTETGQLLRRSCLQAALRRLGERVGFHIFPHQLRHSFATLMLLNGADIATVSSLLGHSSLATTEIYVKAARADAALRAYQRFSPIASLAPTKSQI